MKKIIQLAKNRGKSRDESSRRKSTFSHVSDLSSDYGCPPDSVHNDQIQRRGYDVVNYSDKSFTKLHKACWHGTLEKVTKHVKKNDVNLPDNENRTPMHYAAVSGNRDIIWYLHGCNAKFNVRDGEGRTPLLKAVECNHVHLIKVFLDLGADINIPDCDDNTAVHVAVNSGYVEMLKTVLQYGANADMQNKCGRTALYLSCMDKKINHDVVQLLALHTSSVNLADSHMRTPLMLASKSGDANVVQLLLDNKANVHGKDDMGWTAEDYALMSGHHDIADLLVPDADNKDNYVENDEKDLKRDSLDVSDISNSSRNESNKDAEKGNNEDVDSWNDSSYSDNSAQNRGKVRIKEQLRRASIPIMNLSNMLIPSSEDEDSQQSNNVQAKVLSDNVEATVIDGVNGESSSTDAKDNKATSDSDLKTSLDKKRMSISLGLLDDGDDSDKLSVSSDSNCSSRDRDNLEPIVGTSYVPTVVEHSTKSSSKDKGRDVTADDNLLNLPKNESVPSKRLYQKHSRNNSNVSIGSRSSIKRTSTPSQENVSKLSIPILTDSDWDSDDDGASISEEGVRRDEVEADAVKPSNGVDEIENDKEGTLGRYGTMAGVEEIWANNPRVSVDEVASGEEAIDSDAECSANVDDEDRISIPDVPQRKAKLERSKSSDSQGDVNEDREVDIKSPERENDDPFQQYTDAVNKVQRKMSSNAVEIPSKLTFRRKSLETHSLDENGISDSELRPRLTRASSSYDVLRDGGLMKRISMANCTVGIQQLPSQMDNIDQSPSRPNNSVEPVVGEKLSALNGDRLIRSYSEDSQSCPRSASPDQAVVPTAKKRRFSLTATLRNRKKSVVEFDKCADNLDLIPEDDPAEMDNHKKYGSRKQFRHFKVSPGAGVQSKSMDGTGGSTSASCSKNDSRRFSVAIGDTKSTVATSKALMQTISRRFSLSSPDSDINVNSPEPPEQTSPVGDDGDVSPEAEYNKNAEPIKFEETEVRNSLQLEDVSSPTLSDDSDLFGENNLDQETDYNDHSERISISSSDEDINVAATQMIHRQSQPEKPTEDTMRDLRLALGKELGQKKALQLRVKQLQKDRFKYLKKFDNESVRFTSLNRSLLELESKYKCLQFELEEEKVRKGNLNSLLATVKEQLASKEEQCMSEIKMKQDAVLRMKALKVDLQTANVNIDHLSEECNNPKKWRSNDADKSLVNFDEYERVQQKVRKYEVIVEENEQDKSKLVEKNDNLNKELENMKNLFEEEKANWSRIQQSLTNGKEMMRDSLEDALRKTRLTEEALDKSCLDNASKINNLVRQQNSLTSELEESGRLIKNITDENSKMKILIESRPTEKRVSEVEVELKTTISKLKDDLSNSKEKNSSLETEIATIIKTLSEKEKLLAVNETELKNLSSNKSEVSSLQKELCDLHSRLGVVQEDNARYKLEIEKKMGSFQSNNNPNQDHWSSLLTTLQVDYKSVNSKLEERNALLYEVNERLRNQLRIVENQKLEVEYETKRKDNILADRKQQLEVLTVASKVIETEKDTLERDATELKKQISDLENNLKDAVDKENVLRDKCKDSKKKLAEEQIKLQMIITQNPSPKHRDEVLETIKKLEIENIKLQEKLESKTEKLSDLQNQLQSINKAYVDVKKQTEQVQSKNKLLESKLEEEQSKRIVFANESQGHQSLWESEVRTKSMLGIKINELEERCKSYDDKLIGQKRENELLSDRKRHLESKLQEETNLSIKLNTESVALKAHMKLAKKRIKKLESDPAEIRLRAYKSKFEEAKRASNHIIDGQAEQIEQLHEQVHDLKKSLEIAKSDRRCHQHEISAMKSSENNIGELGAVHHNLEEQLSTFRAQLNNNNNNGGDAIQDRAGIEEYKQQVEANARKELNQQLSLINDHLREQAVAQQKIDTMRSEHETKLREELNTTRDKLSTELSHVKTELDQKVVELTSAHLDNFRMRNSMQADDGRCDETYDNELPSILSPKRDTDVAAMNPNISCLRNGMYGAGEISPSVIRGTPNDGDGLSHTLRNQLELTIQRHLNSGPQVTLDLPDRNSFSSQDSMALDASYKRSKTEYMDFMKRKYFV